MPPQAPYPPQGSYDPRGHNPRYRTTRARSFGSRRLSTKGSRSKLPTLLTSQFDRNLFFKIFLGGYSLGVRRNLTPPLPCLRGAIEYGHSAR